LVLIFVLIFMKPITAHLAIKSEGNAFQHLIKTVRNKRYVTGFLATTLLALHFYWKQKV